MPPSLRKAVCCCYWWRSNCYSISVNPGPSGNDGRKVSATYHTKILLVYGLYCHGHTGKDIMLGKTYTKAECKALLNKDLATVARQINPYIKVDIPETTRGALYSSFTMWVLAI